MLDASTKRRIDTARDILVGKVPDPKSQVEQITIALIYKFMDDMDAESEELGGARKFFAGKYARYGWAKLMRSGLGGHEALNLYAEAIAKMPENPGIPPLFREIFKNAYLPYRDPETLKAFLKIIDEFEYDHSERLGDAFEYLLSVLGSQGDAGQFRTPRHIIDFMVEIVDPKKDDVILDPACGTAGFLISAYKHILKANSTPENIGKKPKDPVDKNGKAALDSSRIPPARGDLLSPDDRARLVKNIRGYDISPDMVRLSLVNLYLHGFPEPHIIEYDTLTSEERWNEHADVILANPPFMSPKGGIKPHKRFSIPAKRSEVLFVDYMAEHLNPNGRAAIIVPEGIIFQSQTAYKRLRKLLVDASLVAVLSLPAGVFNPYSGVKTSILILDKALAKEAETIAFFKIEHDGFGLGAQRRPIDQNDLPQIRAEVTEYLRRLRAREGLTDFAPAHGLIVPKAKLRESGDYNLSGERNRENGVRATLFPTVSLGEVCDLYGGATPSKQDASYWTNGTVKWISSKHIDEHGHIKGHELITEKALDETSTRIAPSGSTIVITRVSVGKFAFANDEYAINQDLTALVSKNTGRLTPEFLRLAAHQIAQVVERSAEGIGVRGVTRKFLSGLQIPLPPLEVQQEIVAEIEGYQKVIDGARAVLDHYKPHIPIHPDWPMVKLGEHFSTSSGGTPSTGNTNYWKGEIPWVSPKDMKSDVIVDTEDHISEAAVAKSSTKLFPAQTVVCVVRSGILKHSFPVAILSRPMCINQDLIAFQPNSGEISNEFLFYMLKTQTASILQEGIKPGVTVQSFHSGFFKEYQIPLPPLETQQAIVAEIEAEQALVNGNRELITRMEQKIQATLARVWGEDAPASAP